MNLRRLAWIVIIAWLAVWPMALSAQVASESALRAAFLFNFVKFTEWPDDVLRPGAPLVMCAVDDAVFDDLQNIVAGKSVGGHSVSAVRSTIDGNHKSCALVYVSRRDNRHCPRIVANLKGQSVLTVSDGEDFIGVGGMIQLITENGRMRFSINTAAAKEARLRLSANLLGLAKTPSQLGQ
jgi:hypothetical protein